VGSSWHRGECLACCRQAIFTHSLSYYAKCLSGMHHLLEIKNDSPKYVPFLLLHTAIGVSDHPHECAHPAVSTIFAL
jgi:hypothetical protein